MLVLLLLSNCAHHKKIDTSVKLTPKIKFELLHPSSFGKEISLTQLVDIKYKKESFEFLSQIEISSDKIIIIGLTADATTRLFTIIYDGKNITIDSIKPVANKLKPAYMLADLQLCLWPIKQLNQRFIQNESTAKTSTDMLVESKDKKLRKLLYANNSLLEISYTAVIHYKADYLYNNIKNNYQLQVKFIDVNELSY